MSYFIVKNCFGEDVKFFTESHVDYELITDVLEGSNLNKLIDGEVRLCEFPMFPEDHKRRPSIIINNPSTGILVMVAAHIEPGDDEWKNYEENILIQDWRYEGFKKRSYANTKGLYFPTQVKILKRLGTLTKNDYDRIVKPTVQRLNDEDTAKLFEALEPDFVFDFLD